MQTLQHRRTPAFVFDIDGVLVKGKNPLPGAKETLELLQELDVPFIFLTNGGGLTEEAHVVRLGMRLDMHTLDSRQFIQSHTPYHDLVKLYADKPILVLGGAGDQIRHVAEAYGFNHVITSSDLYADMPSMHPFPEIAGDHHLKFGRTEPRVITPPTPLVSTESYFAKNEPPVPEIQTPRDTPIAAILLWSSPRDWMFDLQVTLDLLLSTGGVLNSPRSPKNGDTSLENNGYQQDGQPALYFCNPDFQWATQAPVPRLAQGGFRVALEGLWSHATSGAKLFHNVCGKPTGLTYEFGERALAAWNAVPKTTATVELLQDKPAKVGDAVETTTTITVHETREPRAPRDISTVWMVGDNPESDIAGAKAFKSRLGYEWKSVLLETGVYVAGTTPEHVPTRFAKNVKEAVTEILREEGLLE